MRGVRDVATGVEVIRSLDALVATTPTDAVERAHDAITPDTIAKILLTSGSTAMPKGVINTHRMLCSNQQMIAHILPFLRDEPPVLVDWLPWHHTFGGNHNIGLVIHHGGTLYIDDGRPLPGQFAASVKNLREIAPTVYLNVPRGYEELVKAMRDQRRAAADVLQPHARPVLRGGGARAARARTSSTSSRSTTCGERLIHGHRARRDRNGADGDLPHVGLAAVDCDRRAGAGRGSEARAARRQARGPREGPERHAGLLATGRADAEGVRRRRVLQLRRLRALHRSRRHQRRLRVRRTPGRRLQAVHRHVGERRPAARARDRALRAAACATSSSPVTIATRSACSACRMSTPAARLCHDLPARPPARAPCWRIRPLRRGWRTGWRRLRRREPDRASTSRARCSSKSRRRSTRSK